MSIPSSRSAQLTRKRPGDGEQSHDSDAKKQRTAPAATSAAAAVAQQRADHIGALDVEATGLAHAKLTRRTAVHTVKLAFAIRSGPFSFVNTLSVFDQLAADAARPDSLLDLSLVPEGSTVRSDASARGRDGAARY